jgi:F0F1-type ATP synthase assembly protein I
MTSSEMIAIVVGLVVGYVVVTKLFGESTENGSADRSDSEREDSSNQ